MNELDLADKPYMSDGKSKAEDRSPSKSPVGDVCFFWRDDDDQR